MDLEVISENVKNESDSLNEVIDQLKKLSCYSSADKALIIKQLKSISKNIESDVDDIYMVYEETEEKLDTDDFEAENKQLKDILSEKLDWEEKTYIRIKYGISID